MTDSVLMFNLLNVKQAREVRACMLNECKKDTLDYPGKICTSFLNLENSSLEFADGTCNERTVRKFLAERYRFWNRVVRCQCFWFPFQLVMMVWLCAYTSLGVALYAAITYDLHSWSTGLGTVSSLLVGIYSLSGVEVLDHHGLRLLVVTFLMFALGSLTAYVSLHVNNPQAEGNVTCK